MSSCSGSSGLCLQAYQVSHCSKLQRSFCTPLSPTGSKVFRMVWTGEPSLMALILGKCATHCAGLPKLQSPHSFCRSAKLLSSSRKHDLLVSDVHQSAATMLVNYYHFVLLV